MLGSVRTEQRMSVLTKDTKEDKDGGETDGQILQNAVCRDVPVVETNTR